MADPQIVMNRQVPFVDALFRVIEGTAELQHAVDALCDAEQQSGVMIVGEPGWFEVEGVMRLKDGLEPPPIGTVIRLAKKNDGLETFFQGDRALTDPFYYSHLFKLLDKTHLILAGDDFCNSYNFIAHGPMIGPSGTWRWWGGVVAEWANEHWYARPSGLGEVKYAQKKRNWEYMDFYMRSYVNYLVRQYDQWADAVLAVLREKNRQFFRREGLDDLLGEGQ